MIYGINLQLCCMVVNIKNIKQILIYGMKIEHNEFG